MDLATLPIEQQKAFYEAVWKIVRMVPSGKVATYGQIAGYIPGPTGVREETYQSFRARWTGAAMAACPEGVSWQRVINAQGMISQRRGAESQRRMLEAEGIVFDSKDRIDLAVFGWRGPPDEWLDANGFVAPLAPSLF